MSTLRILALGAGVQSTTVLLLSLAGELERLDAAIFADTGWEPTAVYAHLDVLKQRCLAESLPVHVVVGGDVRTVGNLGYGGGLDVPFYVTNRDGSDGVLRRQCTRHLKIRPMRRELRAIMLAAGADHVDQVFGISADEVTRMRDSDVGYITNRYPLVDRGWRRADCQAYLRRSGVQAPRSACIGCPYHSDAEWRAMRDERPAEFAEAVAWERACQEHGVGVNAVPFVHRSRVPLDEVDLSTPEDRGQLSLAFGDECEGLCGV